MDEGGVEHERRIFGSEPQSPIQGCKGNVLFSKHRLAYGQDSQGLRIVGILLKLLRSEFDAVPVSGRGVFAAPGSPVVTITEIQPQQRIIGRIGCGLLEGSDGVVVVQCCSKKVGAGEIGVGRVRRLDLNGALGGTKCVIVEALVHKRSCEIGVTANRIWGEIDDLAKHLRCFVDTSLVVVKGAEPVISGPIVRTERDGLLVGGLGFAELTHPFISVSETPIGGVVGRLVLKDQRELAGSFDIVPTCNSQISETRMGGGGL